MNASLQRQSSHDLTIELFPPPHVSVALVERLNNSLQHKIPLSSRRGGGIARGNSRDIVEKQSISSSISFFSNFERIILINP